MNDDQFDADNEWHANVHLIFAFECQECGVELGFEQVPVGDFGSEFLKYCVAATKEAQVLGWMCVTDFTFLCPKSAAVQQKQSQGQF